MSLFKMIVDCLPFPESLLSKRGAKYHSDYSTTYNHFFVLTRRPWPVQAAVQASVPPLSVSFNLQWKFHPECRARAAEHSTGSAARPLPGPAPSGPLWPGWRPQSRRVPATVHTSPLSLTSDLRTQPPAQPRYVLTAQWPPHPSHSTPAKDSLHKFSLSGII